MNVLFQPHSDDATLFASFLCLRYRPRVITVLRSVKQEQFGITQAERAVEDQNAMAILRCDLEQWPEPDVDPDWDAVAAMMQHLADAEPAEHVFAPAVENGGHEQHSMVGTLTQVIFGERVTHYLTYVRGQGRSRGQEVEFEPEWIGIKYRALACYLSQIKEPSTRPWFVDDPIREYVA